MSQRSQVAKSGSSPIEQCSAACAAPGRTSGGEPGLGQRVVRDRPPDRGGAQRARPAGRAAPRRSPRRSGWRRLRNETTWWETSTSPTREPALAPRPVDALLHDRDVGDLAGRRGVVGVGPGDHGDVVVEVERLDQVGLAAVDVDRAARARCCGPGRRRRCRPPGRSRTRRAGPGAPPVERMSARSAARRRSVQYQPEGRRRSSPASVSASTTSRASGRRARGRPWSAAAPARPRTGAGRARRGCAGSNTVASTGRPSSASGWCTR